MLGYVRLFFQPWKSTWNHRVTSCNYQPVAWFRRLFLVLENLGSSKVVFLPFVVANDETPSNLLPAEFQFLDWTPTNDIFLQEFVPIGVQCKSCSKTKNPILSTNQTLFARMFETIHHQFQLFPFLAFLISCCSWNGFPTVPPVPSVPSILWLP